MRRLHSLPALLRTRLLRAALPLLVQLRVCDLGIRRNTGLQFSCCESPGGPVDLIDHRTGLLMSGSYGFQLPLALLECSLQGALQALQLCDLLLDSRQLLVQEFFDVRTRRHMVRTENQQFTNLVQRKPQFLSLANEFQRFDITEAEQAEPAFGTLRSL